MAQVLIKSKETYMTHVRAIAQSVGKHLVLKLLHMRWLIPTNFYGFLVKIY